MSKYFIKDALIKISKLTKAQCHTAFVIISLPCEKILPETPANQHASIPTLHLKHLQLHQRNVL